MHMGRGLSHGGERAGGYSEAVPLYHPGWGSGDCRGCGGEDEDLAEISGFRPAIRRPCVLSRIAVDSACQNRGIAKELIRHIEREAVRRGFDGIHLIVSKTNFHAKAVYDRMGYACCGECTAFGLEWYCYEKEIF